MDDDYKQHGFEYRYGGKTWGIHIVAQNAQEAKERIAALALAPQYLGELKASIPVPIGGTRRLWARCKRTLRKMKKVIL